MIILGIETSCDETAAAIVDSDRRILSSVTLSQIKQHEAYGGVVPEIAARAHQDLLGSIIQEALKKANCALNDMDGIAVTAGPGLIGGVLVGVMTAKAMAAAANLPYIAVNHLEGHALTVRLTDNLPFPYLLLLASGGHCQFLEVLGVGNYRYLGGTIDDAAGEAFDKIAKLMGLDYPGGPALEKMAKEGDSNRFDLPRPLKGRDGCDLSFSGLKTATRILMEKNDPLSGQDKADMAASFQAAIADCLVDRSYKALEMVTSPLKNFVISGGVAANQYIRSRIQQVCQDRGVTFTAPPLSLCTDNAAMIAWVGVERLQLGLVDSLDFTPRPRWPLA